MAVCFLLPMLQSDTVPGAVLWVQFVNNSAISAAAVKGAACIGDGAPVLNGWHLLYKSCFFGDLKPRFFSAQKKWGFRKTRLCANKENGVFENVSFA